MMIVSNNELAIMDDAIKCFQNAKLVQDKNSDIYKKNIVLAFTISRHLFESLKEIKK